MVFPSALLLQAGTAADGSEAINVIAGISAEHLLADQGYDSDQMIARA